MKYWLTTHWAPSIRNGKVEAHEGVWVKNGCVEAIDPVQPGDLVFIYESAGGQLEQAADSSGNAVPVRRERGRQGIVALLKVTSEYVEIPHQERTRYVNDDQTWWRYHASTESINSMGFVDKARVCQLMGWQPTYSMRGIGRLNSGLQELNEAQFQQMKEDFLASQPTAQDALMKAASAPFSGYGAGDEGPVHKKLKLSVASNPAAVLGEEGLRCVRIEAPFATKDRVDVVLQDRYGRYVMVEIEVDCGPNELAGPLQCIKYRAMWAYLENRPVEEVRTMLVAHSMDRNLMQRVRSAGVECVIVPRSNLK